MGGKRKESRRQCNRDQIQWRCNKGQKDKNKKEIEKGCSLLRLRLKN